LKGFGISRIVYSGRSKKPEAEALLGAEYVSFDTLLKESDVIAVCCALTKETENMFNYNAFSKMKKTAVSARENDS
jgi:glyoxylate/hydroxypyruvate reductase